MRAQAPVNLVNAVNPEIYASFCSRNFSLDFFLFFHSVRRFLNTAEIPVAQNPEYSKQLPHSPMFDVLQGIRAASTFMAKTSNHGLTQVIYLLLRGKYAKVVLGIMLILSLIGLSYSHVAMSSVFWFSLGAFVSIHKIDIFIKIRKFRKIIIGAGLLLVLAYSLAYTEDKEMRMPFYSILQMLTTIVLFANIILLTMNLANSPNGNRLAKMVAPSYFIYLAHEPYMGYVLQLFIKSINFTPPHYAYCLHYTNSCRISYHSHFHLLNDLQDSKKNLSKRFIFRSRR